jgi:hypothetical protein
MLKSCNWLLKDYPLVHVMKYLTFSSRVLLEDKRTHWTEFQNISAAKGTYCLGLLTRVASSS